MKKFFCVSLVAALSLLLFSCSNFFSSSSSDNESAPNGKARVHFSVGKTDARTIMPEIYTEEDISLVELTAQKISEGEATVYKLDGENEKLSWTRLADLENVSIDIDYGTYTFVLNLSIEDEEENKTVLVQTCTLENQEINADTKELVFNMQEDSGDVSIAVSWELRDETNRIGKIKAGLYTIASNGETTIGISDAEKTLTIKGADTSVTATGSYASVPSGSYLIKLFLYDSESSTTPFNTITDIIKVNGYKTKYDLPLEFANLNLQYKVTFDPNGGTWEGGSEDSITTTRNMYSGFIPPAEVSKSGFVLVGWYSFEDGSYSDDITKGTPSDLLDSDKDYTLYAVWGHSVGGSFTTDNRALIIKTDIGADGVLYQNSKINLSVTDSAGEPVTDGVTYAAQILYKGKEINELGEQEKPFYTVDKTKGVITLNGTKNPLPEAKYQLYVTASRELSGASNSVTSSQTFNVKLLDGIETQIALYNSDSSTYPYTHSYYLTDPVGTANLGTADYTASVYFKTANIAFDVAGNFYSIGDKKVVSTNSNANDVDLSSQLVDDYKYNYGILIDLATNIAYSYGINNKILALFKYPSLISNGSIDGAVSYTTINETASNYPSKVAVYDNKLYVCFLQSNDSDKPLLKVYDISSETSPVEYATFDVKEYATSSEMGLLTVNVNDIFAMEGAAYLLVKENFNGNSTNPNIYRRGSVIEYIPPETRNGTGTPPRFLDLKTTPAISKTAISNMALYHDNGNYDGASPLYAEEGSGTPANDAAVVTVANPGAGFPNIYAVAEDDKYLSSPAKVIGLKPKKLVIADDGCAFYSDDDCLKYKNMNRVATIDLEKFVVESVKTTKEAEFSSNISDYLRSDIKLTALDTPTTSQTTGYRFASSGSVWTSVTVSDSDSSNCLYLSVKPGE